MSNPKRFHFDSNNSKRALPNGGSNPPKFVKVQLPPKVELLQKWTNELEQFIKNNPTEREAILLIASTLLNLSKIIRVEDKNVQVEYLDEFVVYLRHLLANVSNNGLIHQWVGDVNMRYT
jgi:hypothetical protein